MRGLFFLCLFCPAMAVAAEPAPAEPCSAQWFDQQLVAQFTAPPAPARYDFMPGKQMPDATLAEQIRQGDFGVVFDVIATTMGGATNVPVNVGLRGSDTLLDPLLQTLQTRLQGKRLEQLTVLLAGPEDMREPYTELMNTAGARLVYVPVHVEQCDKAVKVRKPRPVAATATTAKTAGTMARPAAVAKKAAGRNESKKGSHRNNGDKQDMGKATGKGKAGKPPTPTTVKSTGKPATKSATATVKTSSGKKPAKPASGQQ